MKSDLDRIMTQKSIDALFVVGASGHNAAMTYFTDLVFLTSAYVLKKQGQPAILFHMPMEREEAARTGLQAKNLEDYDTEKLMKDAKGDEVLARALRIQQIFEEFQVEGRVSIYGAGDVGSFYGIFSKVQSLCEGVEIVSEPRPKSVLIEARTTKDEQEVERIRAMGKTTTAVMSNVADYLTTHMAKNGVLVDRQGEVLTIGDVKRRINLWLAMKGADNPEGTIFAIGADAGVPHSAGRDDQPVEVGKTIVFDLFPTEARGGYFYDCTRTWCLGHASDEVLKAYEDVSQVYDEVYRAIKPGRPCKEFQALTCDLFRERGHPTIQEDRSTQEGYVHSLAHGVGLDVHEGPSFRSENDDVLVPGSVITVEPGLYYPKRGFGIRLEDTAWVRPDGTLETLVEYPMDLILEVPGA